MKIVPVGLAIGRGAELELEAANGQRLAQNRFDEGLQQQGEALQQHPPFLLGRRQANLQGTPEPGAGNLEPQLGNRDAQWQEVAQRPQGGYQVRAALGEVADGAVRGGVQLAAQPQAQFRVGVEQSGIAHDAQLLRAAEPGFVTRQQHTGGQVGALQQFRQVRLMQAKFAGEHARVVAGDEGLVVVSAHAPLSLYDPLVSKKDLPQFFHNAYTGLTNCPGAPNHADHHPDRVQRRQPHD